MDAFTETLKKLSVPGSVVVGIGVAGLYFFGIAIYSISSSMLGVPPFDFSLQNCLEVGGAGFVELLAGMPALVAIGIADNISEANAGILFLLGIPLVIYVFFHRARNSERPLVRKLCKVSLVFLLVYMIWMLVVLYFSLLVSVSASNMLLDPQVNVALENRAALLADLDSKVTEVDFHKYGIYGWDGWIANFVLRDQNWVMGKVGAMYSFCGLYFLFGVLLIRSGHNLQNAQNIARFNTGRKFRYLYRTFLGVFVIFFVGFLFVVPARTVVLLGLEHPKADVRIDGMEELTSKYYFSVIGNYEKDYALYNPNAQNILFVQKDKVKVLTLKNGVSLFSDRREFRKTPWLGVSGDWEYEFDAAGNRKRILGFQVVHVIAGSPAARARLVSGDVLQRVGNVDIDGTEGLDAIIERMPLNQNVPLRLMRNSGLLVADVQLQILP